MLDNASIHLSKETQAIFRQINLPTLFLPPYSPTLAPIKLFFRYLKSKIRSIKSKNKTFTELNLETTQFLMLDEKSTKGLLKALGYM